MLSRMSTWAQRAGEQLETTSKYFMADVTGRSQKVVFYCGISLVNKNCIMFNGFSVVAYFSSPFLSNFTAINYDKANFFQTETSDNKSALNAFSCSRSFWVFTLKSTTNYRHWQTQIQTLWALQLQKNRQKKANSASMNELTLLCETFKAFERRPFRHIWHLGQICISSTAMRREITVIMVIPEIVSWSFDAIYELFPLPLLEWNAFVYGTSSLSPTSNLLFFCKLLAGFRPKSHDLIFLHSQWERWYNIELNAKNVKSETTYGKSEQQIQSRRFACFCDPYLFTKTNVNEHCEIVINTLELNKWRLRWKLLQNYRSKGIQSLKID